MNQRNPRMTTLGEVLVFLALTTLLTAATTAIAVSQDVNVTALGDASALGQIALVGTAFMPGIAALIAARLSGGGLASLGLGRGATRRYWKVSYAAPLAFVAAAYAAVWVTGGAGFDLGELAADSPAAGAPEGVAAVVGAILALTAGTIGFGILAVGEELGWRGLMSDRLERAYGLRFATVATGFAWAVFHLPILLVIPGGVDGVPEWYGVLMFSIAVFAMSYPLAWLRREARSIWPAVVLHGAWNAAVYLVCDPLTVERDDTAYFAGETGVALAVTTILTAYAWWLVATRGSPATTLRERSNRPQEA